jgi:hypothetical protein
MSSTTPNTESKRNVVAAPFVFAGFTGDRSGSMVGIYRQSAVGLFEWATDLIESANKNDQQGRMFITCFDTKAEKRLDDVDFKNVDITQRKCYDWMKPRGSTRLYDTAINDLDNIVSKAKEFKENLPRAVKMLNPEVSIVWACCTDGYDNVSTKNAEDLKEKVLWAREQGVKCFFLAANQDAMATGQRYGFSPETSMTYTPDAEHSTMAFRSVSTNMRQASCGLECYFTDNQRQSSQTQDELNPSAPSWQPTNPRTLTQQPPNLQAPNLQAPNLQAPNQHVPSLQTAPSLTRSPRVTFW